MNDYELGQNITYIAKAKEDRKTVMLSFRIDEQTFKELSGIAESEDRTLSYVARRSLNQGLICATPMSDTAGTPVMITFND